SLLPLPRSGPRARRRHPRGARHHADAQFQAGPQFRHPRRHHGAVVAGGKVRRPRRRSRNAQAGRRHGCRRPGAEARKARRRYLSFLHHEPRGSRVRHQPFARHSPAGRTESRLMSVSVSPKRTALLAAARERILVLDGAMGTMIQGLQYDEAAFRAERFKDFHRDVRGNNDLLILTQPKAIEDIHVQYLRAGADIVATNTFSSTSIAQADYDMSDLAYELNLEGAKLARAAADRVTREDRKPRFVAGALGPTNRTASISPDVANPGYRAVTFDDLRQAYGDQARGLLDGGVDLLLVETIFDTLNAKAALYAISEILEERGIDVPVMVSGTITDKSGRLLSGQLPEAFWNSVRHARPITIGFNCALGAEDLRAHIADIGRVADTLVCAYPNAGLPNEFGQYDESPEYMARLIGGFARDGLVNIVGGCCGTTPDHIAAIAAAVAPHKPRI